MAPGVAVVLPDSGGIFFAYGMASGWEDFGENLPGISKEEALVKVGNALVEVLECGPAALANDPGDGFSGAAVNGFDDPSLIALFLAEMPHFIGFYFRNLVRYFWFRHFDPGVNGPPIDKGWPRLEQISQHVEGCLAHRV